MLGIIILFACISTYAQSRELPDDFVYVKEIIPDIEEEIRYAGTHNFLGKPVRSYEAGRAILSLPAAEALKNVQEELKEMGYCLKIFDAYRPQTAVNHFVEWARDPADTLAKQEFYPEVPKSQLFQKGYIASKSGHSRGSTVDLTIIDAQTKEELDMGSAWDFFGIISHHDSEKPTEAQKANRKLLKNIMHKHGFRPYPEEWWHYTLRAEPYPNTYFDFPVK